jgi:hypothetical protein
MAMKKIWLELFIGLLFLMQTLLSIEIVFQKFLENTIGQLSDQDDIQGIFWMFIFFGNLFQMIIMIASMDLRWVYSSFGSIFVYVIIFVKFFGVISDDFSFYHPFSLIFLAYLLIPITLSYLNEKSCKTLYVSLKRHEENLIWFEKLIEKNIPSQIIIFKFDATLEEALSISILKLVRSNEKQF